jgi:hypothetical protein
MLLYTDILSTDTSQKRYLPLIATGEELLLPMPINSDAHVLRDIRWIVMVKNCKPRRVLDCVVHVDMIVASQRVVTCADQHHLS